MTERFKTPILTEAEERIHGERVKAYGPAVESFSMVATIASLLTGKEFTAKDCLLMQVAQKLVRNRYSPSNQDHRRDAVGYLGMLDEVEHDMAQAVDYDATLAFKEGEFYPATLAETVISLGEIFHMSSGEMTHILDQQGYPREECTLLDALASAFRGQYTTKQIVTMLLAKDWILIKKPQGVLLRREVQKA